MTTARLFTLLALASALATAPRAFAQQAAPTQAPAASTASIRTELPVLIDDAKGAHLRGQVSEAVSLIRAKRFAEAQAQADATRRAYEAGFTPGLRQYSFQSREEFLEFSTTKDADFEWIDWGYKQCLQIQAFIAAERRDFATALEISVRMETLAPISAGTAVEVGYILTQQRQYEASLATYRRAHALSLKYLSQRPYQAAALRGAGFALIELKRLDEAEEAFQNSLKAEPMNKLALGELAYIKQLRGER